MQDDTDGKCLGPLGKFAECGDATLWRLRGARRKRSNKSHSEGVDNEQNHSVLYALQMLDVLDLYNYDNDYQSESSSSKIDESQLHPVQRFSNILGNQQDYNKFQRRKELLKRSDPFIASDQECLIMAPSSRRHGNANVSSPLQLGSCASPHAWAWRVDEKGILRHDTAITRQNSPRGIIGAISLALLWNVLAYGNDNARSVAQSGDAYSHRGNVTAELCVYRVTASNGATLAPCDEQTNFEDQRRLVTFSLARHQTSSGATTSSAPSTVTTNQHVTGSDAAKNVSTSGQGRMSKSVAAALQGPSAIAPTIVGGIRQFDSSNAADIRSVAKDLPSKDIRHTTTIGANNRQLEVRDVSRNRELQPLNSLLIIPLNAKLTASIIKGSHPALLSLKDNGRDKDKSRTGEVHHVDSNRVGQQKKIHIDARDRKIQSASHQVGTTQWKIPRHPYIESSRNEIWVDPQTGLEYRTDLCRYLGHERKSSGRHTLVGVGQYTRTALKIKVRRVFSKAVCHFSTFFLLLSRNNVTKPPYSPLHTTGLWSSAICLKTRCTVGSDLCKVCTSHGRSTPSSARFL